MKDGYLQLKSTLQSQGNRLTFDEKRENADLIMIKILQLYIANVNPQGFIESFKQHFYSFQQKLNGLKKEQKFEEFKWRANWFRLMSQFLETYPPLVPI